MESGIRFFYCKTRIDLEVNERCAERVLQKRHTQLGASKSLFSRRRGGEAKKGAESEWLEEHGGR